MISPEGSAPVLNRPIGKSQAAEGNGHLNLIAGRGDLALGIKNDVEADVFSL
jgi:hypothetical protein